MASVLCICDQGYRASIEEQDDTVVWMAHMLQRADDTDAALVLRHSAVNYAHRGQQPAGVSFGDWTQAHPADFPRDLAKFLADGGVVYALTEDVEQHGLTQADLIDGIKPLQREGLAGLVAEYEFVSFW